MRVVLLVEAKMLPLPETIQVFADWGPVSVYSSALGLADVVSGTHMMVEGTAEDLRAWLAPFNGIWLGVDAPALQRFQVAHVGSSRPNIYTEPQDETHLL